MSPQPDGDLGSSEMIHLGGAEAAIAPRPELRRLQAVQRHAAAELREDAEVEVTLAAHRDWWLRGGLVPFLMRWRWRSCSATGEDRVVPGDLITVERMDRIS